MGSEDKRTQLWDQLRKLSKDRQRAMAAAREYVDSTAGDFPALRRHFERLIDLDNDFNEVASQLQALDRCRPES